MKLKLWFCAAALVPAALLGACLSSFFIPMLIGTPWRFDLGSWWLYWQHLDSARVAPYVSDIKWGTSLGFGVPFASWCGMAVLGFRPHKQSTHGDARFASAAEIAKQGFFESSENAIVIGKHRGKILRLAGQQFVMLAAPTRSGKGVGVVIPNLLEYGESVVVLDIKQENHALTSGWRAAQGQSVFLFNPFAEDLRTHRWNPLSYVSPDPRFRVSDIQNIAAMLYPDGADEQAFWVSQSRNAFQALVLYLFDNFNDERDMGLPETSLNFPTLGHVNRLAAGNGSDLKGFLRELSERSFCGTETRLAFSGLLSQADDTFASIVGSLRAPLSAWVNPVLDAATSGNDFWLTDLRKQKMSIYIGIQPNKIAEARLLINLFFSQLINVNTRQLPSQDSTLVNSCLLMMDEFTSIGKVEVIAHAVSYIAGYNLRLMPIIQSVAQLEATYGKETARTLMTNHALQIVFAPREQQDANAYSEMLGYKTLRKTNRSRSSGANGAVTRAEVEERRALMLPQELKSLGKDKEIILYEGLAQPILCEKIRYFEDPYFKQRLLPSAPVPELILRA